MVQRGYTVPVLLIIATLAFTGCASSAPAPSINSTVAADRYKPAMTELISALEGAYPAVVWKSDADTRVVKGNDGCMFVLQTQRGEPSLLQSANDWAAVKELIDPTLEGRGFEPASEGQSFDGGWTGMTSIDDTGAELRFSDKSYTLVQLSVPVTDPEC